MTRLLNRTVFPADLVPLVTPDGGNVGVVIARATLEPVGDTLKPAGEQPPVRYIDTFINDDPAGAIGKASDLVDAKPHCDVVVEQPDQATLEAKHGQRFSLQIGALRFEGEFTLPWSTGPLRRDHKDRVALAGTFDESWQKERMPLLPSDFDPRYHQLAPISQQLESLAGDEVVVLGGLGAGTARYATRLPGFTFVVSARIGKRHVIERARIDTVTVTVNPVTLALVWRLALPCRKLEDIGDVVLQRVRLSAADEVLS